MSKDVLASPEQNGHRDNLPAAEELEELLHLQTFTDDSELKDETIKTSDLSCGW